MIYLVLETPITLQVQHITKRKDQQSSYFCNHRAHYAPREVDTCNWYRPLRTLARPLCTFPPDVASSSPVELPGSNVPTTVPDRCTRSRGQWSGQENNEKKRKYYDRSIRVRKSQNGRKGGHAARRIIQVGYTISSISWELHVHHHPGSRFYFFRVGLDCHCIAWNVFAFIVWFALCSDWSVMDHVYTPFTCFLS